LKLLKSRIFSNHVSTENLKGKYNLEVKSKVKQSLYTPWRRLGGEEI
jgi:hypothetical protein